MVYNFGLPFHIPIPIVHEIILDDTERYEAQNLPRAFRNLFKSKFVLQSHPKAGPLMLHLYTEVPTCYGQHEQWRQYLCEQPLPIPTVLKTVWGLLIDHVVVAASQKAALQSTYIVDPMMCQSSMQVVLISEPESVNVEELVHTTHLQYSL